MRLHRLRITAFGPFAGTVEVDFDRVADTGLFLIRGATGAGKTSLLDAVAFALFADVPGARSKKGLHSDHADRATVPEVSLEFTVGPRRLRVERSPEFLRPKSRGTGETKVPARAILSEHRGGHWQAVSTRHDEIAEVIQDVLGLGLEQFSKVVLLPQGDFAAFLSASPEQRRALLERLFDVAPFTGVEEWLALRRKESALVVDQQRAALAAELALLGEVLAASPAAAAAADSDWSEVPLAELPARVDDARTRLERAAATALAQLDAARLADAAATTAHAAGEELAGARHRLAEAQAKVAALESGRADHVAAVSRLDAAGRAFALSGDLKAFERSAAAVAVATARLTAAEVDTASLALADRPEPALGAVVSLLDAGARTLAEAGHRAARAHEHHRHRVDLDAVSLRVRADQDSVRQSLAVAESSQREAEAALVAAREAHRSSEASTRAIADLAQAHELRSDQLAAAAELATQTMALAGARESAQDLRDTYQRLFQARLDGLAAELAARLHDGDACPVCGSIEHPAPATTAAPVTADDVGHAEERWQAAARRASAVAESVAGLTAAMAQRERQLADETRPLEELASALDRARAGHAGLLARAATIPALEAAVEHATQVARTQTARASALHDELTAATTALEAAARDHAAEAAGVAECLETHRLQCPCAGGEAPTTVAAVVTRHEAVTIAVQEQLEAEQRLTAARSELDQVQSLLTAALAEHGFDAIDEVRSAVLSSDQRSELRRQCDAYERAWAAARAVVDDPSLQAARDAPEPDLPALATARTEARAALLEAASAETLTRRTLDSLHRVATSLVPRCAAVGRAQAEHEGLRELADVVAGTGSTNTLRMRLSAFVLAARLETVVALANERLATMGEGRYQLRHTDGLAARGARSGLGLEVLDLWTGQARETSSLSGGESFMASLALALGLADAVREEAGGFDLQTLFVDEGFGTLDDDSLEQVIDVLDGLREGGRAVGVVSHVAELRTRIAAQVVVDKTERGSTVRLRVADEASPAA